MRVGAVNLASFANVLCHLNTTPLSVAVLAPCAWGESVAWQGAFLGRSGAWQGVVNLATHNTAWRGEFGNETAQQNKIQWHGNKIQHNEFIKATIANGTHSTTNSIKYGEFGNANNARQIRLGKRGENGQCLQAKQTKRKCGSVWAGEFSLSLSRCSHFWHAFGLNLKGFFAHFIIFSSRFIVNFTYFIAISSYLVINFSYFIAVLSRIFVVAFRFIIVLTHLFTHKRHFLGHFAFLKFLNALFLGFLCLSLRAVFAKTAWQSINLALFLLFGLPRSLCSLAMTADFVILSLCKKTKNPYKLKENLPFLDTSLCPV